MNAHLETPQPASKFRIRVIVSLSNARLDDGGFVVVQVLVQRILRSQVRKPEHHLIAGIKRHRSEFHRVDRHFTGFFSIRRIAVRLRGGGVATLGGIRGFRCITGGAFRRVRRLRIRHRFGIRRRFGDRGLVLRHPIRSDPSVRPSREFSSG